MTALEVIQSAIDKLTLQRDLANPGPWMHLDSGDVVLGDRTDPVDAYPMVAECAHLNDADLIESLHGTIDAQLAILQRTAAAVRSAEEIGLAHLIEHGMVHDLTFALARSINGAGA